MTPIRYPTGNDSVGHIKREPMAQGHRRKVRSGTYAAVYGTLSHVFLMYFRDLGEVARNFWDLIRSRFNIPRASLPESQT
jgi:hypothetical protein